MADTSYGVNAPEAVKLWSRKLMREALKQTWLSRFMGEGSDNIIQIYSETQKSEGDRIRAILRMQLTADGIAGDATLEGNEEALTTHTDDLLIDQLRHAVRSAGKMTEQRIPFSVREESRMGLQDWWSGRIDEAGFNQLAGRDDVAAIRAGSQAPTVPSANRWLVIGQANTQAGEDALTTGNTMTLTAIDAAQQIAKTAVPMIRPIMIRGEPHYVCFLHPYQVLDLRKDTNPGQWLDIQKQAQVRGDLNPIFSGALGMYNGVVLHESTRVPTGRTLTTARRAVFCGAQAGFIGYGQEAAGGRMSWVEELFDYGNKLGVSAGMIWGMKKTVYNSEDFGSIVISSRAEATTV